MAPRTGARYGQGCRKPLLGPFTAVAFSIRQTDTRTRMRSRWKAVVAAPLFALSTSCSDGTGVVGPLENLVLAFCASDLPVWFAFQNDGGDWTRVQPDANNSFAFEATPKVAIAMVFDFGSSRLTDIYFTTFAELQPLSNVACTE